GAAAFWTRAGRERAAGRRVEAADALARGASAWAGSELGGSLRALAEQLRAGEPAPWPRPVPGRLGARAGDGPDVVLADSPGEPAGLALLTLEHGKDGARLAQAYQAAAAALPG